MRKDILGLAVWDYFQGRTEYDLRIETSYGEEEEMPVEVFFREEEDMSDLEHIAMQRCRGKVLDIGAGAGCHALSLQSRGADITAVEISPLCVEVMKQSGLEKTIQGDITKYVFSQRFDTLLLLMNGIGLVEKINCLEEFLNHLKGFLNPGGQLLFDSSDIKYLFEGKAFPKDRYYGEIEYRYRYKNKMGEWFPWLYVDFFTLKQIAEESGWKVELIDQDENDQYLVALELV